MTSCYIQDVDPNARVTCGNCGWAGKASETAMIDDIQERITAGETVPAGQCPDEDCGALVYADEPAASSASDTLIELLDDNLTAWEGEEDSVKDEHAELIARLQAYQPKADRYVAALERLWDMLSDTVEAVRLSEADIPDDYRALVEQMVACEAARDAAGREPVEHEPETSPAASKPYSVCFDIDGHGEGREYDRPEEAAADVARYVLNMFRDGNPEDHCLTFGRTETCESSDSQ